VGVHHDFVELPFGRNHEFEDASSGCVRSGIKIGENSRLQDCLHRRFLTLSVVETRRIAPSTPSARVTAVSSIGTTMGLIRRDPNSRFQDCLHWPDWPFGNSRTLQSFHTEAARRWYRSLCRRSQKKRLNWSKMQLHLSRWLPRPLICHPYPEQRFHDRHHSSRSPVR
jgi:hypothetical protein